MMVSGVTGMVPIVPQRIGSRRMASGWLGRALRRGLLAALLAAAGAAPAMADTVTLPPVMAPPSAEHHVGKVIFHELVTPDLAAAKTFYAGLFGWTFRDLHLARSDYAEALLDGHPVAGLIDRPLPPGGQRRPAWLGYISAQDVNAVTQTALQHGGKVLFGPRDVPDRGREAVVADPQGAVFAVLASSSGDPPDVMAEPGEWIWSSLVTRDPDNGAAFYQALFDYEVFDLAANAGARHLMLASSNYSRASVNSLPASRPGLPSHWLNFVRVDDADRVAAKAVALGGRVLLAPRVDRQGGRIAIVADPQGAAVGLLQWSDAKQTGGTP